MSAITMIVMETGGAPPSPVSYTLAPMDIDYGVDRFRCRGRLFRDEDYDNRWSPPVGRESQCTGRVDEYDDYSLCSRCLHNKARWRESCGTAEVRGGDQDWWGRIDDPLPARAPTLAGKNWVTEKKPVWQAIAAVGGAGAPAAEDTVESLTATLTALTADVRAIYFDYECLAVDEDEWPEENEGLDEMLQKEQAELYHLNKAIKDGIILAPAPVPVSVPTGPPETVESLRVKINAKKKDWDNYKNEMNRLLAEDWAPSKVALKAFAEVREKTAVAREILAQRAALNARVTTLEAATVGAATAAAEIAAWKARAAALEEQLADADSLNKTLAEQLAGETRRADEEVANLTGQVEAARAEAAKYRDLFNHLNDSRRIETSEPLRLEEQVAALRVQNAVATSQLYFEMGLCREWQARAYAAEKSPSSTGGATEVHDLREQLVAQKVMETTLKDLRRDVAIWQERSQVAEHELDESREESEAFRRALAQGDDREASLAEERDKWLRNYKELRRVIRDVRRDLKGVLDEDFPEVP